MFKVTTEFKGARSFIMTPVQVALDSDLLKKPKSIILAGYIFTMLNITGKFYMSNKELARRLEVSKVTINDYLNLLEKKGYIKREIVKAETGEIKGRLITAGDTLVKSTLLGWSSSLSQGSKADLTRVVKPTLHKDIKIIDKNNREINTSATDVDAGVKGEQVSEQPKPTKRDLEAEFNELWQLYPRKQGKTQALNHYKAWAKKSKDHTKEVMEKKLKEFLNYLARKHTDPKYYPIGSTWFNGRYDDDYSDPKPVITEPEGFGAPESHAIDQGNPNILDIPDDELPF